MLRQELNTALKSAMKDKDARATSTLRLVLAALKDRDIAARGDGGDEGGIAEEAILEMLQKMIKQRQDSIEQFQKGNRADLAERESEEIAIIQRFLPRQLDPRETAEAVDSVVAESGATSIKDMGRAMALLKERHAGKMDFAHAAKLLKDRLGA